MRARCSASTFILVAAWEQSLRPSSPGNRLPHRKGPLNAENAVRTTGLLTAGRKPRIGVFCLNVHNDHWRETLLFRHSQAAINQR